MRRLVFLAVASVLASSCLSSTAGAATLEPIGKFKRPISVTSDPANAERLLIAERGGVINEVAAGVVTPIADISSLVTCCESERGLLSIVPAPNFSSSGRLYVAYTGTPASGGAEGDVHVDSFRPGPAVDAPIREPILSVAHTINPNHNGGQLQFGPDGDLYISLGDGGGGGDPFHSGQDTESLLGKILRIDPHPGQLPAYSIPAGNPFGAGPGRDEVWAYGLPQPMALLLRSGQWRHGYRRRRPRRTRGGRLCAQSSFGGRWRRRHELRLELSRGHDRLLRGAGRMRSAKRLHRTGLRLPAHGPRQRISPRLLDHRRLRGAGSKPRRSLRPLPLL